MAQDGFHRGVATWAGLIAAAAAIAGVVFTAGDASQRLTAHGVRLDRDEAHQDATDHDVNDLKVLVAVMASKMDDVQVTVHRVDGSPVPSPSGNVGRATRR